MRMCGALVLGLATIGPSYAACLQSNSRSPDAWAKRINGQATLIVDGKVIQEQDAASKRNAVIQPIVVYKGNARHGAVQMALPPRVRMFVEHRYEGFSGRLGERSFLVLYGTAQGYQTNDCTDILVSDPKIRRAIIRHSRRRS